MKVLKDMNELTEAYLIEMCEEIINKGLVSTEHRRTDFTGRFISVSLGKVPESHYNYLVKANLYQSLFKIEAKVNCLAYLLLHEYRANLASQIFKYIIESFQDIKSSELESVSTLIYNLLSSSLEELNTLTSFEINETVSSRFKLLKLCLIYSNYPVFSSSKGQIELFSIPVESRLNESSQAIRCLAALKFSVEKAITIQSNIVTKIITYLLTERGITELSKIENGEIVTPLRSKRSLDIVNDNGAAVKYTTKKRAASTKKKTTATGTSKKVLS